MHGYKKKAFTLIELMVVVAIIAILASMAVSNFSSATKKARNSARVSDIKNVAIALETCNNAMTGQYEFNPDRGGSGTQASTIDANQTATGPYKKSDTTLNSCLNNDVVPKVRGREYSYSLVSGGTGVGGSDAFILCAELEDVPGVETVGNADQDWSSATTVSAIAGVELKSCTAVTSCYFCVKNQQ